MHRHLLRSDGMTSARSRRAAVVATLTTLAGAASLVAGVGRADARSYPCSETDFPEDIWVESSGATYVGVDPVTHNDPANGPNGAWVCFAATGGEAHQNYVAVMAHQPRAGNSSPGVGVDIQGCGPFVPHLSSEQGYWPSCGTTYVLAPTGAEVAPTTSLDPPNDTNGVTGAAVGVGSDTCVYVNSTTPASCPVSGNLVGVAVAQDDVRPVPGKTAIDPNASSPKLVTVTAGPVTVSEDVPTSSHCIGIC
jgi:hypothetical protein